MRDLKNNARKYLVLSNFNENEIEEIINSVQKNIKNENEFMPYIIKIAKTKQATAKHKPLTLGHMQTAYFK